MFNVTEVETKLQDNRQRLQKNKIELLEEQLAYATKEVCTIGKFSFILLIVSHLYLGKRNGDEML